jgi:DnaK suppressor protein
MKKSHSGKIRLAAGKKPSARGPARAERMTGAGKKKAKRVMLPTGYRPTDKEPFMNARMREYFRQKLLKWRDELVRESEETLQSLQEGGIVEPDIADRASIETDRSLELRTRDRARKLIAKIDEALERVEKGTYGYCEETGEPITISRLEARPIATLSIEAQERHERMERTHRDD